MANTQELGLKIWAENENPDFKLWRTELNGDGESDMVKIDRFAKNTKESMSNILVDVEKLKTDLFIPTEEEAIEGVLNKGYMTPYLVSQVIQHTAPNETAQLKHLIKSIYVTSSNQREFEIPMEQFDPEIHIFELRIGGVPFFHERYTVSNGKVILAENEVGIPVGKRIDFVFFYIEQISSFNSAKQVTTDDYNKQTSDTIPTSTVTYYLLQKILQLESEVHQLKTMNALKEGVI